MAKEKFDFIQPLKDLPKTLKGFPKNFIHAWKDPVNSQEEIKTRKKEIYSLLYLFIATAILMAILTSILNNLICGFIFGTLQLISIFGIMACGFLLMVMKKAKRKFEDLECPNCHARITYGSNVSYEVVNSVFEVSKSINNLKSGKSNVEVTGKQKVNFAITCKCQECGTDKKFNLTWVTALCKKSGQTGAYHAGELALELERDIRAEKAADFDGSSGANIIHKYTNDEAVEAYFGNRLQMM